MKHLTDSSRSRQSQDNVVSAVIALRRVFSETRMEVGSGRKILQNIWLKLKLQ
jgi:hypothetical protein